MPYADPEARRAAQRRWYERQRAASGKTPGRPRQRAVRGSLPDSCDGWALRQLECMSRAEVARRLGITRQAVEQAEISGLKKLAAMRDEFQEFL